MSQPTPNLPRPFNTAPGQVWMADDFNDSFEPFSVRDLTRRLGVSIAHAAWQVADGRVVFFAECTRRPLQITLNDSVIERLAALPVAPHEQHWFTRAQITEVILAHELFHLLEPARATHAANEAAAHEFAQRLTGLPFHPTRYEKMLWATFSA
jgi:hypothetical protein